jgi:hypothetical protein
MDTPFLTPLGILFLLYSTKYINLQRNHTMNITSKFGSDWRSGFREED